MKHEYEGELIKIIYTELPEMQFDNICDSLYKRLFELIEDIIKKEQTGNIQKGYIYTPAIDHQQKLEESCEKIINLVNQFGSSLADLTRSNRKQ